MECSSKPTLAGNGWWIVWIVPDGPDCADAGKLMFGPVAARGSVVKSGAEDDLALDLS